MKIFSFLNLFLNKKRIIEKNIAEESACPLGKLYPDTSINAFSGLALWIMNFVNSSNNNPPIILNNNNKA